MDVRAFFERVHQAESKISGDSAVIVSHSSDDGGQAGVFAEVPKRTAATLVVQGKARIATAEEAEQYKADVQERRRVAEEAAAAERVKVTVISDSELRNLRSAARTQK